MKYLVLLVGMVCIVLSAQAAVTEDTVAFGRFGNVHLYYDSLPPKPVALFVSGDGGWNLGVVDMAKILAAEGALVVGVDVRHYLSELAREQEKCVYPAADFEALSQFIQQRLNLNDYTIPVLVGYSSGATLVYAVLVQAPGNTFAGALSLGFCPDLEFPKPFCKGEGLAWTDLPNGQGYNFLPAENLSHPWVVLEGLIDQVCDPPRTAAFVRQVPTGQLITLEHVGHGFSVPKNWEPQFRAAFRRLTTPQADYDAPAMKENEDLSGLPLVELPAPDSTNHTLTILLSGDGGWSSFDQGVARELASNGIAVVGLNSLKYFWKKRTPEESAAAVAALARHYFSAWDRNRLILVGYSFGADVLPHILNRLPDELRQQLALAVLLGPSHNADFEFHVATWLAKESESSLPVIPELEKLHNVKIIALYGDDEKESLCKDVPAGLVKCILMKGGHHFDKDYDTIVRTILSELP
jgi:type IV secretory pathway VirJ component